jgi:beta propeller repeat protein
VGRLTYSRHIIRIFQAWFIPVSVAAVLIVAGHAALANPAPSTEELSEYLSNNSLFVNTETVDGIRQVYYLFNGERIYITNGTNNHLSPVASGQFVTWVETIDGAGQIFLYDVLNKTLLRLSNYSTNQSPFISGNRVVWESWQADRWQIYYFDGQSIHQISSGDTAVRPSINANEIAYAQQSEVTKEWRVLVYDVNTQQSTVVKMGDETQAWPHYVDGQLRTNYPTLD